MKFKYETGVITLVQFISLSLLNIANGFNSVISTCRSTSSDCINNLILSLIFFILITAWFAFVWVLGYTAQERRSRRLAQALICAELLIALVAFFNARHHTDWLSLFTSLLDLLLALWVIVLAVRLMRSGGSRIVSKQRARRRRPPTA